MENKEMINKIIESIPSKEALKTYDIVTLNNISNKIGTLISSGVVTDENIAKFNEIDTFIVSLISEKTAEIKKSASEETTKEVTVTKVAPIPPNTTTVKKRSKLKIFGIGTVVVAVIVAVFLHIHPIKKHSAKPVGDQSAVTNDINKDSSITNYNTINTDTVNIENSEETIINTEEVNVETANVETATVETATVETATVETATVETANVETANVETVNVETANVETTNVETANVTETKETKETEKTEEVTEKKTVTTVVAEQPAIIFEHDDSIKHETVYESIPDESTMEHSTHEVYGEYNWNLDMASDLIVNYGTSSSYAISDLYVLVDNNGLVEFVKASPYQVYNENITGSIISSATTGHTKLIAPTDNVISIVPAKLDTLSGFAADHNNGYADGQYAYIELAKTFIANNTENLLNINKADGTPFTLNNINTLLSNNVPVSALVDTMSAINSNGLQYSKK